MYRIVGQEVRNMLQEVDGLKSNLLQTITKQLNQMDAGGGGGKQYMTGAMQDMNRSGMELE